MYWRTGILLAVFGAALSAQTVPPITVIPQSPAARAKAEALRNFVKSYSKTNQPAVCSIPLLQVRIDNNAIPMPNFTPPAGPDNGNIDNMPKVKLPAPPCEEDKR